MSRIHRIRCLACAAGVASLVGGIGVALGLILPGWQASAVATTGRSADCHISSQPPRRPAAVCDSSSTATTTCGLIPLLAAPFRYPRRPPTPHGQQWAALDCPGPYHFGGVMLIPRAHRPAATALGPLPGPL
jgi:hypothetical protein